MKLILRIGGLVFLLGVAIGVGWFLASGKMLQKITVEPKWINQAQYTGLFVADDRGLYRRNGLKVQIKEFGFETDTLADLLAGKTDMAFTTPEQMLLAVDQGAQLVAIAAFYQISPMSIVSLVGSGIETPADFKDKVLGNKAGNVEENLLYGLMLKEVGLTEKDTTIKKVGLESRELDDLKMRTVDTIDLYRTDQLYFFKREKVKYNLIYPERFGVNSFTDILVVRKDWLNENAEAVKSFLRATIDGWRLAIADQESAIATTLKYVTSEAYKDFDYEMFILEQSTPLIRPTSESNIGIMDVNKWNKLAGALQKAGYLKNNIDVNTVFTNSYLP